VERTKKKKIRIWRKRTMTDNEPPPNIYLASIDTIWPILNHVRQPAGYGKITEIEG